MGVEEPDDRKGKADERPSAPTSDAHQTLSEPPRKARTMMTTIPFDVNSPAGRAVQHLLDTVLSEHVGMGIDVRWSPAGDAAPSRTLVVHPSMPREEHTSITGGILMLVESLAGTGAVNLQQLYALADADQREHIALAVFIAAGYDVGLTEAGRRRAS